MGLLDDASKALNSVSGAGGVGGPVSGEAKFIRDEPLTGDGQDTGGAAGPDPDGSGKFNTLDTGIPTEFIHFGLVHADQGKKFVHKKYTPPGSPPAPPEGHAIMFRDALQREAILLHGFVSSCAVVLQEYEKSKGPIGDIGAAVGDLMGGGPSTTKPDPTQLDSIMSDITAAANLIKDESIKYPDIHEAGKKLHKARADFNKFCESLNDYYLKPATDEGPAGALNQALSAIPPIPGIGNTIQVVQRFVFKMFDIYMAIYLEMRRSHDGQKVDDSLTSYERAIERAAHAMTLDAIKTKFENYAPTFPVWFKKEDPAQNGGDSGDDDNLLKPVNEAIDDVRSKVDEIQNDIYDFAGANQDPEPTPGTPQLEAIFTVLRGSQNRDSSAPLGPPTGADAAINALNATLSDIGGMPSFLTTPIKEVMAANVGLLEDVFKRLMAKEASAPIDNTLLLEAGRRYLTNMISGLGVGLISGMIPTSIQGLSVQDFAGKQLNQYLGKYTEPILLLTIGDLAVALEQSRKKAQQEKAQTMEVYLGRLPWLTALMFRNTFFPIWNLVAEQALGSIAGPLKSVLKEANSKLNAVRDKVDEAKKAQDTAENVADAAKNVSVDASDPKKAADPFNKAKQDAENEAARRKAARDADEAKRKAVDEFIESDQYAQKDAKFPVPSRIADGEGIKVEEELPSVLPEAATSAAAA